MFSRQAILDCIQFKNNMAEQKKSILYSCKSNNHTTRKLFISLRQRKDVDTIQALLQKGVDMDARDSKGRTPLLLACSSHRKNIVNLLIKAGANVHDKCIANECTLLHYASRHGWAKIVRSLVHQVPDLNAMDIRGDTPLHVAARSGHLKIVKCLMKNGADVNRQNLLGFTSLISAAQFQKKGVFDILLTSGAIVDGNVRLLLYYASRNSWTETVQYLVKRVPDLNERYEMGETVLDATSSREHLEVVTLLMKEETDSLRENEMIVQEALYHASYMGHLEVVKWLVKIEGDLKRVLDLNARHKSGYTALYLALHQGHLQVARYLVEKGADINIKNYDGEEPLHVASFRGNLEAVKWLVEKGADINARCSHGTPLHFASLRGHLAVVKWLVKNGVSDVNGRNTNGETALQLASGDTGQLEIIKFLAEEGADVNTIDYYGTTPLHTASFDGSLEVVKWLVNKEADMKGKPELNARDKYGNTALCLASIDGHLDVVKWLLDNGADINVKNCRDKTPLLCAAFYKHKDVFDLLMYSGANLDYEYNDKNWTMLHLASGHGWVDIVHILIKEGCDLDAKNKYGITALAYACSTEQLDTARVLLQAGASWDTAGTKGCIPINCVVAEKRPELIKLFIENGAYLKPADYEAIVKSSLLTVLQDAKLCCQAILNKFNNHDLPELYKLPASGSLPRIEKMKILWDSEVAQAIEQIVGFEIQTNGLCNILEVRPMALSVISVRSVLK